MAVENRCGIEDRVELEAEVRESAIELTHRDYQYRQARARS